MQELDIQQIEESLDAAVDKGIPLTLTTDSDGWKNLHSRFIDIRNDHLLVEPGVDRQGTPQEFVPAERIALSFKLKHHKYLASARIVGITQYLLDDGTQIPVLALCYPTHMHRVQRRVFSRVDVPAGRIVRVSFWQGDAQNEPTGSSSDFPVWSGQVKDLSAGGFRAVLNDGQSLQIEPGDRVGVRIIFGTGEESVYADAQFRHIDDAGNAASEKVGLGFQFLGLPHTNEGRETLKQIAHKVSEFSRAEARARHAHHHRSSVRQ